MVIHNFVQVPSKVVSMVTEIRYAGNESTENIHFKSGETVRLIYRVQVNAYKYVH